MLCVTFDGWRLLLDALTSNIDLWVHLYTFDQKIVAGLTRLDLPEPRNPSYKPLQITSWTPAVLVSNRAISFGETVQFSRTAEGKGYQVWGYFLTQGEQGPLIGTERGSHAPYAYTTATDRIQVSVRMRMPPLPHTPCPPAIVAGRGVEVQSGIGVLYHGLGGVVVQGEL